jgi:lysophospholipase L1-like esterase
VPNLCRLLPTALVAALTAAALLPAAAAHARVTAADASAPVLVVGDSLAVGLKPYLGGLLGEHVAWDAKSGRTTPQGLVALRTALQTVRPATVVVSLGTNDGPDPTRFTSRIDRALAAIGSHACVVWSNIFRPARKGPYVALNGALEQEAARVSRLHLVDWNGAVTRKAVALPDGLHPDAAGFAYRARMIARTVRADCPTTVGDVLPTDGTTGGVAAPD